jgi:hypothetical protein
MAFYNEINDQTNFSISFSSLPRQDCGAFAEGYKDAANQMAQELIERGSFPDYQAYPVVFLYRHALELHLKNIIYKVAKLLAFQKIEEVDSKLYNSHDLTMLSQISCSVLKKAMPSEKELYQFLEEVAQTAKEFSEIDPSSYSYRYPIDRYGKASAKRNQTVNLTSLAIHMDSILDKLSDIDFGLNIENDKAQEIYEMLESF